MFDSLTERISRELNVGNNNFEDYNDVPTTTTTTHSRLLSRKTSDNNGNTNQQNLHQPSITYKQETSRLPVLRASRSLFEDKISDKFDDTDGTVRTSRCMSRNRLDNNNYYEFSESPRHPLQKLVKKSSKHASNIPVQFRSSHKMHLTSNSLSVAQTNDDNEDDDDDEDDDDNFNKNDGKRHRHIRHNHLVHQSPTRNGNHEFHNVRSPVLPQRIKPRPNISPINPSRLIFIRHGERINQAFGPDWFIKAFRKHTYKPYDPNLPSDLPKRRFYQAYEFDVPLTVHGLKTARFLGQTMLNNNLIVDICLSSPALRCIQTSERILAGMERRDGIRIRIEPGLFECPHLNHKLVESFMTKKELLDNGYNIKHEYKPLFPKLIAPESLDDYFERSAATIRGILDRYGPFGRTILIVTHAPGLLALTDAIKRRKPITETFYRIVSKYSPLSMYIAEFDGSKWRHSHQPFNLIANGE